MTTKRLDSLSKIGETVSIELRRCDEHIGL